MFFRVACPVNLRGVFVVGKSKLDLNGGQGLWRFATSPAGLWPL